MEQGAAVHLGNHRDHRHHFCQCSHSSHFSILQVVRVEKKEACVHPVIDSGRHGCAARRVLLPGKVGVVLLCDVIWNAHTGLSVHQSWRVLRRSRDIDQGGPTVKMQSVIDRLAGLYMLTRHCRARSADASGIAGLQLRRT